MAEQGASQATFYKELPVTPRRVLAFYWLWAWRALLGGLLFGGICGFVIGFFGAMLKIDRTILSVANMAAGSIASIVWTYLVLRMAFRKQYRDFRIVFVSAPVPSGQ